MINTHQFITIGILIGLFTGLLGSSGLEDAVNVVIGRTNDVNTLVNSTKTSLNDTGADLSERSYDSTIGSVFAFSKLGVKVLWYGFLPFGNFFSAVSTDNTLERIIRIPVSVLQLLFVIYGIILFWDKIIVRNKAD